MENPKIRFKGFTKDWEQRKLRECAEFNPKSELPDVFEYIDLESVVGTNILSHRTESKSSAPSRAQRLAQKGDVFYQTVRPYQKNNCIFEKNDNNWVFSTGYAQLRPVNDSYFLLTLLQNEDFVKLVLDRCTGTSYPAINSNDLADIDVNVPSDSKEQQQIGTYFKQLDHLITLHQRKCEQTKKLKKYMLQKMFPQNGAKVPEIRFDGFTYDWEQRKLGDVFEQTSNLVNPKEDEIELWSLTVEDGLTKKSDRYNREFLVKKDDNFKEVRPGDIVYNPMNMTLGAVGYNGMAKSVAVSGYYTTMVAKENYDTYYINTWLKSPQAIRLYRTYATGSLIEKQRVQFPTLSIIPVTFPKYEEQIKIGSYFHSIDNLITLHQRKCDELKKMKKYMLQNMFI